MSSLDLLLLGSPRIERQGVEIALDRHKSLALLAYVAISERRQSRDELAALLWPDSNQSAARGLLRRTLAALQRQIGHEWLQVDRDEIGLSAEADLRIDVHAYHRHLAERERHGHPLGEVCRACLEPLRQAASLYRGDFMAGFSLPDCPGFEEWQLFQAESLRQVMVGVLAQLVRGYTVQHEFDTAIDYARRWLALDPLNEAAHRDLMRLFNWQGDRASALAQYRECEQVLGSDLGLPPQTETTRLYRAIQQDQLSPPPPGFLPLPFAAPAVRSHSLPLQLTPFIGRERELDEIGRLLHDPGCRLMSLVGPGGVGKTRLAIEAAAQHVGAFQHGGHFIGLAALSSPDYILSTMADALKLSFYGPLDPKQQIVNYLREKEMLLVMDNFEHLTEAAPLTAEILQDAPRVKTLVTSRERLNLHGEYALEIGGLTFPKDKSTARDARYSAIELFINSAKRHNPAYVTSEADLPHIIRLCRLVEGMPLAIELAAAWIRMLPVADIVDEIERDLDFLTTTQHNVPARHRSLRAVFEHSWRLLSEPQRLALTDLSIFQGGFGREAAERVTGASTRLLAGLIDKSFVRRSAVRRYELHAPLRQYLANKLKEDPDREVRVRERFGLFYAEFLHKRQRALRAGRQKEMLADIGGEIDNVRAAWQWAIDHRQWDVVDQGLESLFFFYDLRSRFQEGAEVFNATAEGLARSSDPERHTSDERVLANVLARQGRLLQRASRYGQARALFQRSLDMHARLGAQHDSAFALTYFGDLLRVVGEYDEARQLLSQAIEIATATGDGYLLARALNNMGIVASSQGNYETAERLFRDSLAIQQDLGDQAGMSLVLNNLGGVAFLRKDYEQARYFYEESLGIQATIDDLRGAAVSLHNIAEMLMTSNQHAEARRLLEEALAIDREIGDRRGIAYSLDKLGETASALGQTRAATAHFLDALGMAMEAKAVPVALNVLVGIADIWTHRHEYRHALEIIAFVLLHPATAQQTRDRAERLQAQIESEVGPHESAAARAGAQTSSLDEVVRRVLGMEQANKPRHAQN